MVRAGSLQLCPTNLLPFSGRQRMRSHGKMSEANNGQDRFTAENATIAAPAQPKPKRHNAKRCLFRVRQRIINELVWGDTVSATARTLHVSRNTIMAIREQHGG